MRARVMVVVLLSAAVVTVGLILQLVVSARQNDARVRCLNNLRLHGQVAESLVTLRGQAPPPIVPGDMPGAVPAGTVFVVGRPPEDRLSWIADALPVMEATLQPRKALAARLQVNERELPRILANTRQPTTALADQLDQAAKWDAGTNVDIGRQRLKLFTCPSNVPDIPATDPAVTQYVGLAGVGTDAATLPLFQPYSGPNWPASGRFVGGRFFPFPTIPARAGCFRYDAPTPFSVIHRGDGVDTTLMFAEVSGDLGPWMRGGPATVRGVDDTAGATPPVGFGGQFGGNHPHGITGVAYVGGAAKFITPRIDPAVFRAMVTISGRDTEMLPGGE